ncbi:hypothetical protein [Emticicia oligotrophica]|uniref:hypothetical protein n=1 Tax=Emticicia oligotrophica TaxID=312279 RepID=UPI00273BC930|nr:hypothetical protein [Emticicia oligotrophica]
MKSCKLFLILLLLPFSVFSQYISPPTTICNADEITTPSLLEVYKDLEGNDYVFWRETNNANPQIAFIKVQKYNKFNIPQWNNCGISIKAVSLFDFSVAESEKIKTISDKNGGIFFFTGIDVNSLNGAGELWGQHISSDGNLGWGANGKIFDSGKFLLRVIAVNLSNDNNISILWEWGNIAKSINFQRCGQDGTLIFNNPITIESNAVGFSTYLLKDATQDEYIITSKETGVDDKIYSHVRVNVNGTLTTNILPNMTNTNCYIYPGEKYKYYFEGKYIDNVFKTFFNVINDDGSFVFNPSKDVTPLNFYKAERGFSSHGQYVFVLNQQDGVQYIQKFDALGNKIWNGNGTSVVDGYGSFINFHACENGGINIFFSGLYQEVPSLKYQYIDILGKSLFQEGKLIHSPHNNFFLSTPINGCCGENLYRGQNFDLVRQQVFPFIEKCIPFEVKKTK